jgi:hypothetical protein
MAFSEFPTLSSKNMTFKVFLTIARHPEILIGRLTKERRKAPEFIHGQQ